MTSRIDPAPTGDAVVSPEDAEATLRRAAGAVARARLADAFGHVSLRQGEGIAVTPAIPLAEVAVHGVPVHVQFGAEELPDPAPREAWLPLAVAEEVPRAGGIVRAQPRAVAAFASLGRALPVLYGHAAMLGGVHVHSRSLPARDRASAEEIVAAAAGAACIVLRGNGVVVWGETVAEAVARLWVLESTADLALRAWAAGEPDELPPDEQDWWRAHAPGLLPRIYRHLCHPSSQTPLKGEQQ